MIKEALCPLCGEYLKCDFYSLDENVVYMDGWHHRDCLDEHMYGPEEQLPTVNSEGELD